jgi:cephalosporin hydroxylase
MPLFRMRRRGGCPYACRVHPRLRKLGYASNLRWRSRFGDLRDGLRTGPPPRVEADPAEPLGEFWRRRIDQDQGESWAGVPMAKLPEDLRAYQHALWDSAPDTVIEIGTKFGGSALWFRDQLRMLASYGRIEGPGRVISVDAHAGVVERMLDRADPGWREEITFLVGDVTEPETVARIHELAGPGRCLVVEDAAHTYEVTTAALSGLSPLVPPGGFFVVEDGHVDMPELHPEGPQYIKLEGEHAVGVQRAISDFLNTTAGANFEVRRDYEPYGITAHPGGFLRRRAVEG